MLSHKPVAEPLKETVNDGLQAKMDQGLERMSKVLEQVLLRVVKEGFFLVSVYKPSLAKPAEK